MKLPHFSPGAGFPFSRRAFLQGVSLAAAAQGLGAARVIPGFERGEDDPSLHEAWKPASDRKIRVGIAGHGYCRFGADFSFQNHPNVEVVAVTDLVPERCAEMAQACRCNRTYPSLEEMLKDDRIEAVFLATDAPNHANHAIAALGRGKHVACAVPAVFGSLEDADRLFDAVRKSGLVYMMFETSCFHHDVYVMRKLYTAGELGKVVYSEGEYYHYKSEPLPSWKEWRTGLPPQWYPTHSNAYHLGVTGGSFLEVCCMGMPSKIPHLQAANNRYANPFGTEVALFRTVEGTMARMAVSWDTPGNQGEVGRFRTEKGSHDERIEALKATGNIRRPPLPPGVKPGGHGGSHGHLTEEFVRSILENRKPLVDVALALNLTVSGIVAHQSALKNGELLKIPQYKYWSA